jgi:hypothetical protein
MKKIVLAVSLLAASLLPSHAQGSSRNISARILCLQHQQQIDSVRFGPGPENLGKPQRLLIGDYSLPFPVEIAENSLRVFKDAGAADATPIASTKIPADANHVTLLFLPGTDTPYQIVPIPDASSDFKADHTRFINLAPIPVRFRIEDQLVDLPPGKLQTLTSLPKRDNFNMANVALASLIDKEWKVVSQTQWHFVAGNRLLILVYVRPGTQRLVSVSFKDRPGSEKAPNLARTSD